jgi:hypothetical protein
VKAGGGGVQRTVVVTMSDHIPGYQQCYGINDGGNFRYKELNRRTLEYADSQQESYDELASPLHPVRSVVQLRVGTVDSMGTRIPVRLVASASEDVVGLNCR